MGGWRSADIWSERGKFYIHVKTETLARRRGICAPQRPTGGPLDNTCSNMWAGGGGEDANRRPQRLSGTSEVPKGGAPSDRHRKPWADRPGTALHAKTEVPSRRKLDVEIL